MAAIIANTHMNLITAMTNLKVITFVEYLIVIKITDGNIEWIGSEVKDMI